MAEYTYRTLPKPAAVSSFAPNDDNGRKPKMAELCSNSATAKPQYAPSNILPPAWGHRQKKVTDWPPRMVGSSPGSRVTDQAVRNKRQRTQ